MKRKEVLAVNIIAFIGKLLLGCLGCLLSGLQWVWNKAVGWAMAYLTAPPPQRGIAGSCQTVLRSRH